MEENKGFFNELYSVNVNAYTEEKNGLTYLSWAYAVAEVCKRYDKIFDYEIKKFGENNLPYVYDDKVGFMVFTSVTIGEKTRECWLPVMDNNNNAMLKEKYTYQVKKYEYNPNTRKREWNGEYEDKIVEAATMFDVNKTIMRCLVKNLAMFGLGLYIYAGEDLPAEEPITAGQKAEMKELGIDFNAVAKWAKIDNIDLLSKDKAQAVIDAKKKSLAGQKDDNNV